MRFSESTRYPALITFSFLSIFVHSFKQYYGMLFSHVKILCFRAKAELVFHRCLYNKAWFVVIFAINTTSDISKLLWIWDSFEISRIRYLCQISLQIMLFFVYSTTLKRLVIFTRRYFKLSWNTTVLSQSSCRNFSCNSIKPVIHCIPFCSWMKEASCNWTDTISSTISLCSEFKLENIYRGVNFCGKKCLR